jgi:hypothetical protein
MDVPCFSHLNSPKQPTIYKFSYVEKQVLLFNI